MAIDHEVVKIPLTHDKEYFELTIIRGLEGKIIAVFVVPQENLAVPKVIQNQAKTIVRENYGYDGRIIYIQSPEIQKIEIYFQN